MTTGTVKKVVLDRGFGFIVDADGYSYFFHMSDLFDVTLADLQVGSAVRFLATDSLKGLRARSVERA